MATNTGLSVSRTHKRPSKPGLSSSEWFSAAPFVPCRLTARLAGSTLRPGEQRALNDCEGHRR